MTIGLALVGLAAIAAAAHPRGARSLMGFMGTPEEHLAKFREYLVAAQNPDLPRRFRLSLVERAYAESEWATVPAEEMQALITVQNVVDEQQSPWRAPEFFAPPKSSARSNLVVSREKRGVDPRHPPAGWKRLHTHKGVTWSVESLGGGNYTMTSPQGHSHTGSGNTVLSKVAGHAMNAYFAFRLGNPGDSFNPASPPPGWFIATNRT